MEPTTAIPTHPLIDGWFQWFLCIKTTSFFFILLKQTHIYQTGVLFNNQILKITHLSHDLSIWNQTDAIGLLAQISKSALETCIQSLKVTSSRVQSRTLNDSPRRRRRRSGIALEDRQSDIHRVMKLLRLEWASSSIGSTDLGLFKLIASTSSQHLNEQTNERPSSLARKTSTFRRFELLANERKVFWESKWRRWAS